MDFMILLADKNWIEIRKGHRKIIINTDCNNDHNSTGSSENDYFWISVKRNCNAHISIGSCNKTKPVKDDRIA
jgi:hypothetical protein